MRKVGKKIMLDIWSQRHPKISGPFCWKNWGKSEILSAYIIWIMHHQDGFDSNDNGSQLIKLISNIDILLDSRYTALHKPSLLHIVRVCVCDIFTSIYINWLLFERNIVKVTSDTERTVGLWRRFRIWIKLIIPKLRGIRRCKHGQQFYSK